jgi:hypothetical protein
MALAGTPDDSSWIEPEPVGIAQLTAELVTPDGCASVNADRGANSCTVASNSDMVLAAAAAKYAAAGIAAFESGAPVSVPDIAAITTCRSFGGGLTLVDTTAAVIAEQQW